MIVSLQSIQTLNNLYIYLLFLFTISFILKLKPLVTKHTSLWYRHGKFNWINKLLFGGISEFAKIWNCYEIHNIENIQKNSKNCILVGYHSRCTLDLLYLISYIKPAIVTHSLLFQIPLLGSILSSLEFISSRDSSTDDSEKAFVNAVANGKKPVLLIPGGFWEATKPYSDRKVIEWKTIPGFVRLIAREPSLGRNTRVVPFHTKNGDEVYLTTIGWRNWSGEAVRDLYSMMKKGHIWVFPFLAVLLLMSLGFMLCPLPVKMDTFFGEPLTMEEDENEERFATRVLMSTQSLMDTVEEMPPRHRSDLMPLPALVLTLGVLTLVQNFMIISTTNTLLLFIGFPLVAFVTSVGKLFVRKQKR